MGRHGDIRDMRAISWLVLPVAAGLGLLATRVVPGPRPDGTVVLPSGWRIHPAGRQVLVGTLPLNLVVLSDGQLAVPANGYGANGVRGVDPAAGRLVWMLPQRAAWVGLAGAGAGGHDTLWASGGGTNRVYRFIRADSTWARDSVRLADSTAKLFVAGLAVVPGRGLVAAVGNLSDSVYLLDAATLARRGTFQVGHRPYTVVADSSHLYVSNWGDSTVSVIDLSGNPILRPSSVFVGPHPSALALRGRELFVALAGANGVARLDLATGTVIEQLTVALGPHAPVGSDPNALALSPDGRALYVAMAGNNAVAAVSIGPKTMQVAGLIPVGWYPTAVAMAPGGKTLYVANGKGNGSGPNPDHKYIGDVITGSVSIIPVPDAERLARYTREVYALSPYTNQSLRASARPAARPPIRHVVYVIRENRTYDQVLGDLRPGNGDPSLALFNDSVTPNVHAMARRWVVFDNFYVDGEVSADGHEWSDRAFAGDYNEKTWPAIYSNRREWDLTSGEDLANPRDAYLWDAARKKRLWVVNFGEGVEGDSAAGTYQTNFPGLRGITDLHFPSFVLAIPDTVRARMFADSVDSWDRQGRFPDLVLLYLPRDHTLGRRAGRLTPRAMVADNDLALGRVVERLSRSPAWPAMALFALEDDAQNGPDHVDAHRSVLVLASPWARRGVVDSTFYTTSSVLRTIGQLLGLPPLSQYDAGATPLWNAFTTRRDTLPFHALPAIWPLEELNPQAFRSRIPDRDFAGPDRADERLLNEEIWASVRPRLRMPAPRRSLLVVRSDPD
jgi:hypothetical protein